MQTLRHPLLLILFVLALAVAAIGTGHAQQRGQISRSFNTYAAPPRPMMPSQVMAPPRMPQMAPRQPQISPQFNTASRGPAMPPGTTTGVRMARPLPLPPSIRQNSPIAQMPSYTKRITITGAPIVVSRTGATYSVPQQGVFSTRITTTYRPIRIALIQKYGSGRVVVLQQRLVRVATGTKVVTAKIGSAGSGGSGGGGNSSASNRAATNDNRLDYSATFETNLKNFSPGHQRFRGTLDEDLLLVQYHRSDKKLGKGRSAAWWTSNVQSKELLNVGSIRSKLALPPGWGPRDSMTISKIPKGTAVEYASGLAKPQSEGNVIYMGGGTQYLFKSFDPSWIVETRKIGSDN